MANQRSLQALRVVALSGLLALLTVVLMAVSVSAHTVAPAHSSLRLDNTPMVKIETEHHRFEFKPQQFTVKAGGNITFKNDTHQNQVVTLNNAPLYAIPSHSIKTFPVTLAPGTYALHLQSNPHATLNLTVK